MRCRSLWPAGMVWSMGPYADGLIRYSSPMTLPIESFSLFSSLLPDTGGWLLAAAEPSLRIDEGFAADWTDRPQESGDSASASIRFVVVALLMFVAAALVWWRWRPVTLLPVRWRFRRDISPATRQVAELRRRHEQHRQHESNQRVDSLLELHRLYSRGDAKAAYEGLKQHFETHPFELNLYIVCLNMLAETGIKPPPEMIRLLRHAFRQLKLLRPHMWVAVAEQGKRLAPGFERWDDKPSLPARRGART